MFRKAKRQGSAGGFTLVAAAALILVGGVACEDDPAGIAEEEVVLAADVLAAMEETLKDEFRAEMIYEKVIGDLGSVRPFTNIIYAEVRHSEAIAALYAARSIPVPSNEWEWEDIPSFSSVPAACQAGVEAEIDNAAIYDRYFSLSLPDDVRRVFENNQAASLNKHLPAFQRCS